MAACRTDSSGSRFAASARASSERFPYRHRPSHSPNPAATCDGAPGYSRPERCRCCPVCCVESPVTNEFFRQLLVIRPHFRHRRTQRRQAASHARMLAVLVQDQPLRMLCATLESAYLCDSYLPSPSSTPSGSHHNCASMPSLWKSSVIFLMESPGKVSERGFQSP